MSTKSTPTPHRLTEIRKDLKAMTLTGGLCNTVWGKWKRVAKIPQYKRMCSDEQWVKLCAIVALHRAGKPITEKSVEVFIRNNGDDPYKFLVGFASVSQRNLIGDVFGKDLPEFIEDNWGVRPSEPTLRRWMSEAGLQYSRLEKYSSEAIKAVVHVYMRLRTEKALRAQQLATIRWRTSAA